MKAFTVHTDAAAGHTGLKDLPLSALEAIYTFADHKTKKSLAQTSHIFRGFWKTLRICEGCVRNCPTKVTMTGCTLYHDSLLQGAEVLARHISVGAYTIDTSGSRLILGETQYYISLNGHFGPRHLSYIMQQDTKDLQCLAGWTAGTVMQKIKAGFNSMFRDGERLAASVLLRLKLYHGRQDGVSDDELERISMLFARLPWNFNNWCEEQVLVSVIEPVWQVVSPGGTTVLAHWDARSSACDLVVDLHSLLP